MTRYQEARNTMPIRLYPHQQRLLDILCNHNSHVRLWRTYRIYKHLFDRYPDMLKMFYENDGG